jgi:two-component system chemotaxis response regulator CheB
MMMPGFPADLPVPVLIVQHMPPVFTTSLARSLDAKCAIHIKEAEDKEPITAGKALIAPGGRHMKVEASHDGKTRVVRITDDPPVNSCRPSVDYLFKSVAQHYVGRATGVIMTGMGSDGFEGLKLMKKNGAIIIAQDEQSCVVYGMPKGPVESGIADVVAPLGSLAQQIVKTLK